MAFGQARRNPRNVLPKVAKVTYAAPHFALSGESGTKHNGS
jgi:hypothetical protein